MTVYWIFFNLQGPLARGWKAIPIQYSTYILYFIFGFTIIMLLIARYVSRYVTFIYRFHSLLFEITIGFFHDFISFFFKDNNLYIWKLFHYWSHLKFINDCPLVYICDIWYLFNSSWSYLVYIPTSGP